MLGNLPTLADRNFVLGFIVPALVGGVALLLYFGSSAWAAGWLDALLAKDIATAAYGAATVWLAAVLLLMFNDSLYRFLQGYPAAFQRLPGRDEAWELIAAMQVEVAQLGTRYADLGDQLPADEVARYQDLRQRLSTLPSRSTDLMPTRFGNAIKTFEIYSRDVYGADGVTVWWRLMAVASKDYLATVQDARTQVDLPVNVWAVATLLAGVALARGLRHAALTGAVPWHDIAWCLVMALAGWLAYRWAVSMVPAWGSLVMAGFDCFLPTLATQLGHPLPATAAQRRDFWERFSELANYRLDPDGGTPFDPRPERPARPPWKASRPVRWPR